MRSKLSLPPITVAGRDKRDFVSSLALWFASGPKAEAVDGQRSRTLESRAALSLICLELLQARTAARICLGTQQRSSLDAQFTNEAWQAHRATIALELPLSDWTAVVAAYDAVSSIKSGACDAPTSDKPGSPCKIGAELIMPMLEKIEQGCIALAPYALDVMRVPAE